MRLALSVLERAVGHRFMVAELRLLVRDSLRLLLKRAWRIRATAASMLRAETAPPMPLRLQVETIDICNLKCRMCSREVLADMNTRTMPLEEFTGMVDVIQPLYVTMNGLGEPLLDKSIFEKLAFLRERGIMSSMPTNGTHLSGTRLERLAANMPDILQMSIDGATRRSFESIRVDGKFDEIVENYGSIVRLQRDGHARRESRIRILCALQKDNIEDFREMYLLVKSMPGVSFSLVPVFDYDAEGHAFAALIPSREDVERVHRRLADAIANSTSDDEVKFYRDWRSVSSVWLVDSSDVSSPALSKHSCLVPWYNAYVDAKGRVFPCCYLLSEPSQVMGNIQDESFEQIWTGRKYQAFRRGLVEDRSRVDGCRTCSRNDDGRLARLRSLAALLGTGRRAAIGAAKLSGVPAPMLDGSAARARRTIWLRSKGEASSAEIDR